MAADRTIAGAHARAATLRRMKQAAAAREQARSERNLARQMAEPIAPGWGRLFQIRMPEAKPPVLKSEPVRKCPNISTSRRALRAYRSPLIDSRGRVALYLKIGYVGFRSKGWRAGLPAAHIDYIYRDGVLELGDLQLDAPISNMGESVAEIAAAWRMLETVEEGYRANAKVQYRLVLNLPHELSAEQRQEMVQSFCKRTFGRVGLPYAAAVHEPDIKSDQRNFHAHICFSTRPCERTSAYRWAVSEEKVNGLTDPAGLLLIRALAAAHLNRAAQSAGQPTRFTHQTYAQRGLNAVRQEHIGPAAMAAHDRGETVGAVKRNELIVTANEAADDCRQTERELALAQREEELLQRASRLEDRRRAIRSDLERFSGIRSMASRVSGWPRRALQQTRNKASLAVIAIRQDAAKVCKRLAQAARRQPVIMSSVILVRQRTAAICDSLIALSTREHYGVAIANVAVIRTTAVVTAKRLRNSRSRYDRLPLRTTIGAITMTQARIANVALQRIKAQPTKSRASSLEAAIRRLSEQRARTDRLRADVDRWRQHFDARHRAIQTDTIAAARAMFNASKKPPYLIDGTRIILDLSAFAADEVALFRSLDTDTQVDILKDRYARDQEEARILRETMEKAANEAAARARQTLVDEACRLVLQFALRPYRIVDDRIVTDWSGLSADERATLEAFDKDDPHLRKAILARVQRDCKAEAATQSHQVLVGESAPSPAGPPPPDTYAVKSLKTRQERDRSAATMDATPQQKNRDTNLSADPQTAASDATQKDQPQSPTRPRRWHPGMMNDGPER
ncbi:MobA/MobL family protein [Sphingobium sp. TomMM35A]